MPAEAQDTQFLVECFREFHAEVLRQRQHIAEPGSMDADEDSVQVQESDIVAEEESQEFRPGDGSAEQIQRTLRELIERQTQAVLRRGDPREQRRFREVLYVMVALADEVFLQLPWPGKDYWNSHLLEEYAFYSHDAGTRFFENVQQLLSSRDPMRADVATVYYMALALGFRGRCQDLQGSAQIEHYQNQLFTSLFQRNPGLGADTRLFPSAYENTLRDRPPRLLPQLRPWLMSLAAIAVIYLIASHLIWTFGAAPVASALEELSPRRRAEVQGAERASR
jgi:type VI secretion system protein ImpK